MSFFLRWERFAPGPVRAVSVIPEKPGQARPKGKAKAKAKGKGVKRKAEDQSAEIFRADEPNTEPSVAVPAEDQGLPEPGANEAPVDPPAFPLPERSNFAGRTKPNTPAGLKIFEERRDKFYASLPAHFWRDKLQREYWLLCNETPDDLDAAIAKFREKHPEDAVNPRPAAARGGRGRGRGRGKATARH